MRDLDRYILSKMSFIVSFILCLMFLNVSKSFAAISTVASEQSGTTISVINHIGAGSFTTRNGCGNITPSTPAGSNGDLLIAVAAVRETNATVTASAGWTQYYTENHGAGGNQDLEAYIFYRIADGTGSDNITLTSGGAGNCRSLIGQVSRFDGVDSASPFETSPIVAGNSSTNNANTVTTGTETTTDANAMLIVASFINDNASITEADGFSESFDSASTTGRDSSIALAYRQESTSGSKGAFSWSKTSGTDENIGVLFALTPDNSLQGISINVPSGTTTDDVMISAIAVGPSSTGITAPSGWTLINRQDQGTATSNSQAIYYRVATASEPGSYTWIFSGGAVNGSAAGIASYRGVDTASVVNVSGSQATSSSTSHAAPSINTTVSSAMIVVAYSYSSSENWTEPASMAEQVDIVSTGTPAADGISLGMADVIQVNQGPTATYTATAAGNADTGVVNVIALTPLVFSETVTVNFSANINNVMAGSVSLLNAAVGSPEDNNSSTSTSGTTIGPTSLTPTLNAWLIDSAVSEDAGSFSFAGQAEIWEETTGGAVGVMSKKEDVAAGANSMSQTHSSGGTNRMAHVAVSVAPNSTSTNITQDAFASTNDSGNTVTWTHSLSSSSTASIKLIVAIAFEENGTCNDTINSVTYGNTNLIQVVSEQLVGGGTCKQVEIWYGDITSIIVSTDNNSTLGGQAIDQDEAVEYIAVNDSGSLFFDDATFGNNARLDALHQYDNENIAISVAGNGESVGGNAIPNGSIALLTPSATAGIYNFGSILFDESNFASGDENIDAVYVRDNGNVVLSTNNNANLPGIGNFDDDDIVEWNGTTATLVFNIASIPGAANNWDVDALHFLDDDPNLILFSLYNNRTIGPTTYENGDVLLYNRNTSTLSVYFSENNFTSGNEDVDAVTLSVPPFTGSDVDHYRISYPNGAIGVTCEASQVTITAHDTGDNAVNVSGGTVLTLNAYIDGTTTNTGTWESVVTGGGTFGGAANPATYTWPSGTGESSVTLELRQLTPVTIDIDLSDDNGDAEKGDGDNSDSEDPEIEFRDAIFRVVDSTPAAVDITTKLSGKQSNTAGTGFQDLYLQAIETVSATECQGVFESENNVTVEMAFECDNPTSCETIDVEIEDDGGTLQAIPDNPNGTVTNYSGVQFDFDADSKTPLRFVYDDAGRITLHARYDIDPSGSTVYMSGQSGPSGGFVVKPAGLCVESLDANSTCPSADPDNPDCSTPFRKAGDLDAENFFNLTVRGVTWQNDSESNTDFCSGNVTTPNFELSSITLSPNLIAPGGSNATLGVASVDVVDADKGTNTEANQSVDEVGVFTITATAPSYFGETITTSTSANIGRFYPDRFNVALQSIPLNVPAFTDSCSGFTYLDQTFYYGTAPILEITALNSDGDTTNNYGGSFWRLTSSLLNRDYTDGSSAVNASLFPNTTVTGGVTLAGDSDFDGIGTLSLASGMAGDSFIYQKGAPESVFDANIDVTFLAAAFQDTDHTAPFPVCYDITNDGTCDDFSHSAMQGTEQRWGRIVLENGFGSELLAIEVPLAVEYYQTNDFEVNTDDTCTTYNSTDMSFSNEDGVTLGNLTLSGSGTMVSGRDDPANPILANSTANETGSADVTIDLTSQDWLQFDWDEDTNYDDDPSSRITWGIFAGPDEFIYIREPW